MASFSYRISAIEKRLHGKPQPISGYHNELTEFAETELLRARLRVLATYEAVKGIPSKQKSLCFEKEIRGLLEILKAIRDYQKQGKLPPEKSPPRPLPKKESLPHLHTFGIINRNP